MTRIPTPEQWVLTRMDELQSAEMIETHIDFYVVNEDGDRRSVHLTTPFVKHFMRRDDGALPTIVAIATAPIVLADGTMLAPDGFDRDRGIAFMIPQPLRDIIPQRKDCTETAVKAAMAFLVDEWLCDVVTDNAGKYGLISLALTLIERTVLPERPCFFITAGKRGAGKTATLTMTITAVTGARPAAAAWSTNEEERRKALLSYFMSGAAYILWDNIPRGVQISCPHVERSCTAAFYADRKLGVSEMVATAASTIHIFTGNNISARGDLASRSLHVRLTVDRADPENRKFKHPDPVGWTEDHRAEILTALYTILLGNPQLRTPSNAPAKTRFKLWWRLVGSAVEHAAKLHSKQNLDFEKLFLAQEGEQDEEAIFVAEALNTLAKRWPQGFFATDVAEFIARQNNPEGRSIRQFLYPGSDDGFMASPRSVGKQLQRHLDEPVLNDGCTLTLRKKQGKPSRDMRGSLSYLVEKR